MKYRDFGTSDWKVSALGFGIMRMPHEEGDESRLLEEECGEMVRHAIDSGVNYIDTAYNYHEGSSESFLGRALDGGYRERVRLATKLPCWMIESGDDFDRLFDEQLERLRTDRIDYYLLHGLQRDWWDQLKGYGYREWAERQIADGRIGNAAFSFHDKLPLFKSIVDDWDLWSMTLVMYNYMDVEYQAGAEGVKYAYDRGLAVVVMEPLRGGLLAKEPPASVRRMFDGVPISRTPADWALQWLWDQPEVSCVLSGMSSMEQLRQNIASADRSGVGTLSDDERSLLAAVREEYLSKKPVDCTGCRYCMPCPEGVAIPHILSVYNMGRMYEAEDIARWHYSFVGEEHRPGACTGCGQCMEKCPQHLDIIRLLKTAHGYLA